MEKENNPLLINSKKAYERVLKKRGYERRPDGLYKNGIKLSELIKNEYPRIEGKAAADLTQRLREMDRFRANSLARSGRKVII